MAIKIQIACHKNSMCVSLMDLISFVRDEEMVIIQVDASNNDVDHGFGFQQFELDARLLERSY